MDQRLHIVGERCDECKGMRLGWVHKGKGMRVERMPTDERAFLAVKIVPRNGMSYVGKMHTQLMCAPRDGRRRHQRVTVFGSKHTIFRFCRIRIGSVGRTDLAYDDAFLGAVSAGVDHAAALFQLSVQHRKVIFLDAARLKLLCQKPCRVLVTRDQKQSACVAIQTVDGAKNKGDAVLPITVGKCVCYRIVIVIVRGVSGHIRPLGGNNDVLVLVKNF